MRKVDYTLTNTNFEKGDDDYDYLEEGLKEHFGRFMKDYQHGKYTKKKCGNQMDTALSLIYFKLFY